MHQVTPVHVEVGARVDLEAGSVVVDGCGVAPHVLGAAWECHVDATLLLDGLGRTSLHITTW